MKKYLGDSVYGSYDGFGVTIWLDNGEGPFSEIYLEPDVIESILRLMKDE